MYRKIMNFLESWKDSRRLSNTFARMLRITISL